MTPLAIILLALLFGSLIGFWLTGFVLGGIVYRRSDDPSADRFDEEWRRLTALRDAEERDI